MTLTDTLKVALSLHEITRDPLLFDAVRALTTPGTPPAIAETAEKYVHNQHVAYLQLFQNSDNHPHHGNHTPADID